MRHTKFRCVEDVAEEKLAKLMRLVAEKSVCSC